MRTRDDVVNDSIEAITNYDAINDDESRMKVLKKWEYDEDISVVLNTSTLKSEYYKEVVSVTHNHLVKLNEFKINPKAIIDRNNLAVITENKGNYSSDQA